jgi:hypothetical protein
MKRNNKDSYRMSEKQRIQTTRWLCIHHSGLARWAANSVLLASALRAQMQSWRVRTCDIYSRSQVLIPQEIKKPPLKNREGFWYTIQDSNLRPTD